LEVIDQFGADLEVIKEKLHYSLNNLKQTKEEIIN